VNNSTENPDAHESLAKLRVLRTPHAGDLDLPLFLPVYQPDKTAGAMDSWATEFGVRGCIVNAYFLYKNREIRNLFDQGVDIHDHIGFHGLVMTDSGAYQGFNRPLLLANKKIVAFQDKIGADIASPLDLVTPPGDKRSVAEKKLDSTLKRIREAKTICRRAILAGVQQGGRFRDLRRRSVEELMSIGVDYIAIGSLVPFFNRNHNLKFVTQVMRDARKITGPDLPIHIFGAGDPVELPFLAALGADIFDSSSYGHYAAGGWYMTAYGAINDADKISESGVACECPVCSRTPDFRDLLRCEPDLRVHNLWTIMSTVRRMRDAICAGTLDSLLADILDRHTALFPDSDLGPTYGP